MLKNKTIIQFICLLFLTFYGPVGIMGQEVLMGDKNILNDFDIRIKQFNEFVDRFNFLTDFKGEKITPEFKSKVKRIDYLKILFNIQDPRLLMDKPSFSPEYRNLILEFVTQVSSDSIYISKYSDRIIANAKTRVKYKNEPKYIAMYLNREVLSKNRIKWVITSVYADFLDIVKEDTTMVRFIPPNSHELDFMNVKRALEDKEHLDDYAKTGFVYDPLSVFFFNVKNGTIIMDYVSDVEYFIFDVPGWCIKIKDFNRSGSNSGWLIDNLWKTNDDPIHFLNTL